MESDKSLVQRTKRVGSMSADIWGNLWSTNQSAFARHYMTTTIEKRHCLSSCGLA